MIAEKVGTPELVAQYLAYCKQKGLSIFTIKGYSAHLGHFARAFPGSPPDNYPEIHKFLNQVIKKKDARPRIRKSLLAFYAYLEREKVGTNPIPRLPMGRPKKIVPLRAEKVGRGGSDNTLRIELHIFFHQSIT